jgi:hypothetical protein
MDQFDIDYSQQVVEILQPDKRKPVTIGFLTALTKSTLQFLRDAFLGRYRLGSTDPAWSAGTYARGAFVQYQKSVWVSLIDGNTDTPGTTQNWYQTQANFLGLSERILYNGQKVILEYALNRWFGTNFVQPGAGTSDIYLTTNVQSLAVFRFGDTESISSSFFYDRSTEGFGDMDIVSAGFVNGTINVPLAVYNALDPVAGNRDNIIRAFADKYVYAGLSYNIVTY